MTEEGGRLIAPLHLLFAPDTASDGEREKDMRKTDRTSAYKKEWEEEEEEKKTYDGALYVRTTVGRPSLIQFVIPYLTHYSVVQHKGSPLLSVCLSLSLAFDRCTTRKNYVRKGPFSCSPLFICGAADRSGRGKRCSSCCCCWGGTIFQSPMYSFLGCEKAKTLSKKGCEKAKTLSKILFSSPQISESIPFLFYSMSPSHSLLDVSGASLSSALRDV